MKIKNTKFILIFLILISFFSCGYKFTGSGNFPKGVTKVYIPIFENKTSETSVETTLTNELSLQIIKKGKVTIVEDKDQADAYLYGTIITLKDNSVSSDDSETSGESKLTLYADIKLKKTDGKILLNLKNINDSKSYVTSSSNKQTTLNNKSEALSTLCENLAEAIYNRLTDDF
ncbi:MAG: LptE family protein [Deltaproteobacteria bacterium]|nr:LptE family protein [Deltaproteobacteria bacterium]